MTLSFHLSVYYFRETSYRKDNSSCLTLCSKPCDKKFEPHGPRCVGPTRSLRQSFVDTPYSRISSIIWILPRKEHRRMLHRQGPSIMVSRPWTSNFSSRKTRLTSERPEHLPTLSSSKGQAERRSIACGSQHPRALVHPGPEQDQSLNKTLAARRLPYLTPQFAFRHIRLGGPDISGPHSLSVLGRCTQRHLIGDGAFSNGRDNLHQFEIFRFGIRLHTLHKLSTIDPLWQHGREWQ